MSDPLSTLLAHPAIWRASRFQAAHDCQRQRQRAIPSGFARLDRELPEGGWPHAGVVELLQPCQGQGELPLLAPALAKLGEQKRWLAWITPPWIPYAPALERHGIPLDRVLLIRPGSPRDALWALEQCLGSGACAAALGWLGDLQPLHIRRLQLAARHGECLAVLMRHQRHADSASPAPLRLQLAYEPELAHDQRHCKVRLLKRQGRWPSDWISLHWAAPVTQRWHQGAPADAASPAEALPVVPVVPAPQPRHRTARPGD